MAEIRSDGRSAETIDWVEKPHRLARRAETARYGDSLQPESGHRRARRQPSGGKWTRAADSIRRGLNAVLVDTPWWLIQTVRLQIGATAVMVMPRVMGPPTGRRQSVRASEVYAPPVGSPTSRRRPSSRPFGARFVHRPEQDWRLGPSKYPDHNPPRCKDVLHRHDSATATRVRIGVTGPLAPSL